MEHLRGAHAIHEEIKKRKLKIAIAGIPKTIDNDIDLIQKSFGFETAFSIANDIISNAHNEAQEHITELPLLSLWAAIQDSLQPAPLLQLRRLILCLYLK
ncbi:MAG: 6-phosphofructokinase [Marinilabiliales bacterium]|nr:6-phosphofructokinase [Marinilabiliales bacterium]